MATVKHYQNPASHTTTWEIGLEDFEMHKLWLARHNQDDPTFTEKERDFLDKCETGQVPLSYMIMGLALMVSKIEKVALNDPL